MKSRQVEENFRWKVGKEEEEERGKGMTLKSPIELKIAEGN
jgi:hypothetical protein